MASPPIGLDRPPSLPPSVTAQMGGAPPLDVASAISPSGQGGAAQGAGGPKGQFMGQCDATRKMVQITAQMEEGFAPYADKILALIDAGQAAVMGSQAGGPNPQATAADQTAGSPTPPSPMPPGHGGTGQGAASPFPG